MPALYNKTTLDLSGAHMNICDSLENPETSRIFSQCFSGSGRFSTVCNMRHTQCEQTDFESGYSTFTSVGSRLKVCALETKKGTRDTGNTESTLLPVPYMYNESV